MDFYLIGLINIFVCLKKEVNFIKKKQYRAMELCKQLQNSMHSKIVLIYSIQFSFVRWVIEVLPF